MKVPINMWPTSPTEPLLPGPARAHVWSAGLDVGEDLHKRFLTLLSAAERERAGRFKFEKDRRRFVAARGVLRRLLGKYLRIAPEDVVFRFGRHGKPDLAGGGPLKFNISHSEDLALFGFVREGPVGVDLEHTGRKVGIEEIAGRFFSRNEYRKLLALPEAERLRGFYRCWTRKEAFIKALGEGLSFPLDQFEVSLGPGEPARLVAMRPDPEEAARWSLRSLKPKPGFIGALAVRGELDQIECRHWRPEAF